MSVVSTFAKIRPRRGTATAWGAANPVLDEGEFVIEVPDGGVGTGITRVKIGDGIHQYNSLPYAIDGEAANSINGGGVTGTVGRDIHLIQIRSGTASAWETQNPKIAKNEIVFDETHYSFKVGDGVRFYKDLPYINAGGVIAPDVDGGEETNVN